MNLLALVLLLPLLGFLLLLFLPRQNSALFSSVALVVSLVTFVASLGLIPAVLHAPAEYTSVTDFLWLQNPAIHFHIGLDGINLWLVLLTTLLVPIAIWISGAEIQTRQKEYYSFLLLFEFGLIGVFTSLDLFLFYVFWEVALVPMYLLVGIWGGERRTYAAVKFFLYTFFGSVLMLAGIIYLSTRAGTFDYTQITAAISSGKLVLSSTEQLILFLGFFAAFAIKVPIFPLHTWLPLTYAEAPTAATFLLAAVMSKMGTFGLIRYCLPLFPNGARSCASWIAALAIIGIIYGALLALVQPNLKRLIAYSSISHLGFIVLGIFSFNQQGADGAVYQMIAHGISTGALFLLVGYLYQRRQSLEIDDFGGWAKATPKLAAVFMIASLASIGLPSLSNFIGEFLVLQGAAAANFKWAVWAAVGVILSAAYMLTLYQKTFLGPANQQAASVPDLSIREWIPLLPLLLLMIWLGSYTQTFMPSISAANSRVLEQTKINVEFRVQANPPVSGSTAFLGGGE